MQQLDADLVDAAAAPVHAATSCAKKAWLRSAQAPTRAVEDRPVRSSSNSRDAPGVLDHLAGVVGHQVAVAAGHGAGPAQRTVRLLVQEPGQEQPIAPEPERGDQLGQLRC